MATPNPIEKECGCIVEVESCDDGTFYPITRCPLHEAAENLLATCENIAEKLLEVSGDLLIFLESEDADLINTRPVDRSCTAIESARHDLDAAIAKAKEQL